MRRLVYLLTAAGSQIVFVHYRFGDDHFEIHVMDADGSNSQTVADCDPNLFCDFPSWGVYDGVLPAATIARVRTGAGPAAAKASRAGRVHRLRRAIRRELSGAAYVADRR